MATFTFVTSNAGKLREVQQILLSSASTIKITSFDLPSAVEIQGTTQEVAKAKVEAAALELNGPCITEDTALGFVALGGLPGPYIKSFMKELGHDGLNKMLQGFTNKKATAICTFAYSAGPGKEAVLFEGRTDGYIVPARGPKNFGWDPIFEVGETGKTYAEMDGEEKNLLSHRYKALTKLGDYLKTLS